MKRSLMSQMIAAIAFGLGALLPLAAFGESSAVSNIQAIADRMNAQIEEERKRAQERARDEARKTNQQNLMPNMLGHLAKAAEHMKQAEDERKRQNFPQAQQQEQMAKMEQGKAQQLDKQMQENEKSAKANNDGAQKMLNQEPIKQPATATQNAVTSLREAGYNAAQSAQGTYGATPEPSPSIPKEELTNLASVSIPTPEAKPVASTSPAPVDPGPEPSASAKFGYDEEIRSAAKSAAPASATTTGASGGAQSPAAAIAAGGPSGGTSAASGTGEFWSSVGNLVDAENKQLTAAENKLSMKGLRGISKKDDEDKDSDDELPGSNLSDEQFWKKVGKEPSKCRASTKISERKRGRCLRLARRELERKWRASNRRPASDKPKPREEGKPVSGAKVAETAPKTNP